jgi:hypothetical protein
MNEQQLATLIRDAMSNFINARQGKGNAYLYVRLRYPHLGAEDMVDKMNEVEARVLAAEKIQRLAGQIAEAFVDAINDLGDDD